MKAALLLALGALPLFGCASVADAPIVENGPARADGPVAFGSPVEVGRLVVTPMKLVEDSRCPINARCVWAGRLVIDARIDGPGWRETVQLELGKPYITRGETVTLTSAQPSPVTQAPTPGSAYRFDFEP